MKQVLIFLALTQHSSKLILNVVDAKSAFPQNS